MTQLDITAGIPNGPIDRIQREFVIVSSGIAFFPLFSAYFPMTEVVSFSMHRNGSRDYSAKVKLTIPAVDNPALSSLSLSLLNSLERILGGSYNALIRAPHGCFEQVFVQNSLDFRHLLPFIL